jgi:RNA polymerase sigma factor (sigma-70 family)
MSGHGTAMTNIASDEELMLRVRADQRDVLGLLFDRYQAPLFNFYFKLTGSRVASEDLVQEVFLRILKYRRSYRPGASFRTWMYQIARNTRLKHVRNEAPASEWDSAEHSPTVFPTDTAEQTEEIARLYRALWQMPHDKRELLILSRFQGLKHEDIADLYGCSIGAVRVKIHRALQDLRTRFHKLENPCRQRERGPESASTLVAAGSGS